MKPEKKKKIDKDLWDDDEKEEDDTWNVKTEEELEYRDEYY